MGTSVKNIKGQGINSGGKSGSLKAFQAIILECLLFFSDVPEISEETESGLLRPGDFRFLEDDLLLVGVIEDGLAVFPDDFRGELWSPLLDRSCIKTNRCNPK